MNNPSPPTNFFLTFHIKSKIKEIDLSYGLTPLSTRLQGVLGRLLPLVRDYITSILEKKYCPGLM